MECPSSPSREMIQRSRMQYENLSRNILQQEKFHAEGKKPRRTRFALEADLRIQAIMASVMQIRKRVLAIQTDFKSVEGKVNRLDVIKEQVCFFMSPKRVLDSVNSSSRRNSPTKLTYMFPTTEFCSDRAYISPIDAKLVDFIRRRKLVSIHIAKIFERIDVEKRMLEEIFDSNISLLRLKRAEKCLVKMIMVQSRIKLLGKEFEGLGERLLSEDSFDEDSIYNINHGRSN